jgi:hypothetical protein
LCQPTSTPNKALINTDKLPVSKSAQTEENFMSFIGLGPKVQKKSEFSGLLRPISGRGGLPDGPQMALKNPQNTCLTYTNMKN